MKFKLEVFLSERKRDMLASQRCRKTSKNELRDLFAGRIKVLNRKTSEWSE